MDFNKTGQSKCQTLIQGKCCISNERFNAQKHAMQNRKVLGKWNWQNLPPNNKFQGSRIKIAMLRTFLEPKAPQNHPDVHYSICAVSTAHHYMSDMYVHDYKCGNVFHPAWIMGVSHKSLEHRFRRSSLWPCCPHFWNPLKKNETLNFCSVPPPGVYPNMMMTASVVFLCPSVVLRTPWDHHLWQVRLVYDQSAVPAKGLGLTLPTFHMRRIALLCLRSFLLLHSRSLSPLQAAFGA